MELEWVIEEIVEEKLEELRKEIEEIKEEIDEIWRDLDRIWKNIQELGELEEEVEYGKRYLMEEIQRAQRKAYEVEEKLKVECRRGRWDEI